MALSDETKDKINTAIGVGKVSVPTHLALVSWLHLFAFPAEHRRLRMDPIRALCWLHQVEPSAELN